MLNRITYTILTCKTAVRQDLPYNIRTRYVRLIAVLGKLVVEIRRKYMYTCVYAFECERVIQR